MTLQPTELDRWLKEAMQWAANCCAWGIDGSSELFNNRLRLLQELRNAAFAYGVEAGRKKAEGIDWSSEIEQRKLDRLLHEAIKNIESQVGAALLAYPEYFRNMLAMALSAVDDANTRLEQIHDISGGEELS